MQNCNEGLPRDPRRAFDLIPHSLLNRLERFLLAKIILTTRSLPLFNLMARPIRRAPLASVTESASPPVGTGNRKGSSQHLSFPISFTSSDALGFRVPDYPDLMPWTINCASVSISRFELAGSTWQS